MGDLQNELSEIQAGEKQHAEREIKAARERQNAIEDLERGVSSPLIM